MENKDIKMLLDAFFTLCDHIKCSEKSCSICPLKEKNCFDQNRNKEIQRINIKDVEMLLDAFFTLCDYIEYSDQSCSVCPLGKEICFNQTNEKGINFWKTMNKIENEITTKNMCNSERK